MTVRSGLGEATPARAIPGCCRRAKPRLSSRAINSTRGNCARIMSGVPSREALSTTITRAARCDCDPDRQTARTGSAPADSRTFHETMTTLTSAVRSWLINRDGLRIDAVVDRRNLHIFVNQTGPEIQRIARRLLGDFDAARDLRLLVSGGR